MVMFVSLENQINALTLPCLSRHHNICKRSDAATIALEALTAAIVRGLGLFPAIGRDAGAEQNVRRDVSRPAWSIKLKIQGEDAGGNTRIFSFQMSCSFLPEIKWVPRFRTFGAL